MSYKYPYIPREYYAATMFACKLIREHGTFNRAISTAANYYDVDSDELEKHVRARQAAGQKGASTGRKYKYWVVSKYYDSWDIENADTLAYPETVIVKRATSQKNATKIKEINKYEWYGFRILGGPFEKKADADEFAKDAISELKSWPREMIFESKFNRGKGVIV